MFTSLCTHVHKYTHTIRNDKEKIISIVNSKTMQKCRGQRSDPKLLLGTLWVSQVLLHATLESIIDSQISRAEGHQDGTDSLLPMTIQTTEEKPLTALFCFVLFSNGLMESQCFNRKKKKDEHISPFPVIPNSSTQLPICLEGLPNWPSLFYR